MNGRFFIAFGKLHVSSRIRLILLIFVSEPRLAYLSVLFNTSQLLVENVCLPRCAEIFLRLHLKSVVYIDVHTYVWKLKYIQIPSCIKSLSWWRNSLYVDGKHYLKTYVWPILSLKILLTDLVLLDCHRKTSWNAKMITVVGSSRLSTIMTVCWSSNIKYLERDF